MKAAAAKSQAASDNIIAAVPGLGEPPATAKRIHSCALTPRLNAKECEAMLDWFVAQGELLLHTDPQSAERTYQWPKRRAISPPKRES